jgi:Putative zinc-finger
MRCPSAHESGAYVLGALTPAEREAYEHHLADCASCREEVAELAVLPGLLGRIDDAAVEQLVGGGSVAAPPRAPETLLPKLLWAAQASRVAQRRRRRWQTVGVGLVAAFVAVLAGIGVNLVVRDSSPPSIQMSAMHSVTSEPVPVSAEVALIPTDQGTKIRIHCVYEVDTDHDRWTFRLFVVPRSGTPQEVGAWTAKYGDDIWEDESTWVALPDIARVELRRGDGVTALLVYEPA